MLDTDEYIILRIMADMRTMTTAEVVCHALTCGNLLHLQAAFRTLDIRGETHTRTL